MLHIITDGVDLAVALENNSSVDALCRLLKKGPMTITMKDYAHMEKFGSLGVNLPRNDEQITTEPGDVILSDGNLLVLYYAPNTWRFTRLGKMHACSPEELRALLGSGNITATLRIDEN